MRKRRSNFYIDHANKISNLLSKHDIAHYIEYNKNNDGELVSADITVCTNNPNRSIVYYFYPSITKIANQEIVDIPYNKALESTIVAYNKTKDFDIKIISGKNVKKIS